MGGVPADMVQLCFPAPGFKGFDTALMYSGGKSETLLGEMAGWKGVSEMATKVGERLDYSLPFHSDQPLGWQKLGKRERKEASRRLPFQTTGLAQCPYCIGGQSPDQHHNHGIKL